MTPRHIELEIMIADGDQYVVNENSKAKFTSPSTPPPTLLVNRESRHETLRYYTPISHFDKSLEITVYYNPEIDTIVIEAKSLGIVFRGSLLRDLSSVFINQVKSLAFLPMNYDILDRFLTRMDWIQKKMAINPAYVSPCLPWNNFMGLEKLEFIIDPEKCDIDQFAPEKLEACTTTILQHIKRAQSFTHSANTNFKIPDVSFRFLGLADVEVHDEGSGKMEAENGPDEESHGSREGAPNYQPRQH
jgi:hypothetical protein